MAIDLMQIEIPVQRGGRSESGTNMHKEISSLTVGQSAWFVAKISTVSASANNIRKKFPQRRFTTRLMTEDGKKITRVWRLPDAIVQAAAE